MKATDRPTYPDPRAEAQALADQAHARALAAFHVLDQDQAGRVIDSLIDALGSAMAALAALGIKAK